MQINGLGCCNSRGFVVLTLILSLVFIAHASGADKETILYSFSGNDDGLQPWAGLVSDAAGSLYGVTYYGGPNRQGEVFRVSRDTGGRWVKCVPHAFTGATDGSGPYGGLTFDRLGNLYGTTTSGGAFGGGTAFKLTGKGCTWRLSVLYQFGRAHDGSFPAATMIFDRLGNLYGTTEAGGTYGYGTVFELVMSSGGRWGEHVLHSFNGADGWQPWASVIFDRNENLYGTTSVGGKYTFGVVFELSRGKDSKWEERVLHNFTGGTDGSEPNAGLIFDTSGNLYGASVYGGAYARGNIFELTRRDSGTWKETVLHNFTGGTDGASPWDTPIFDSAGNLYGTAYEGGDDNGSVFQLKRSSKGWQIVTLYLFQGGRTGKCPIAPLIRDRAGNLYGTALRGGIGNAGVVFQIAATAVRHGPL